ASWCPWRVLVPVSGGSPGRGVCVAGDGVAAAQAGAPSAPVHFGGGVMAQGWSGSTRRERLPNDWRQRRAYILERDGFRCRAFLPDGRRRPRDATDVDHLPENVDDSNQDRQALSRGHHNPKTGRHGGKRSQEARRRRKNLRKTEKHWTPQVGVDD